MKVTMKQGPIHVRDDQPLLDPGEHHCPKCDGTGLEYKPDGDVPPHCKHCRGTGKLDWVEKVIGKQGPVMVRPGVYTIEVDVSEYIPSAVEEWYEWSIEESDST